MEHNNFYMSNTESTVLVIIVAFDSLFLDLIKAKENPAVKKKMLQKEVLSQKIVDPKRFGFSYNKFSLFITHTQWLV